MNQHTAFSGAGSLPAPETPGPLHTKFFMPPPRPRRVARPRLLAVLRADPPPPVTLVAAPAGYGKTTLVVDWIATDARQAAWVSLDAGDNDPGTFWQALATALHTVHPSASARALAVLRQPHPPAPAALLRVLLNDLAAHPAPDPAGRPLLLVLDDYHVITQPAIHDSVIHLIAQLPDYLQLVITSRSDPPLRLSRLRVRAQLLEIRAADLAFDAGETATFLRETMGLAVPEAAAVLAARTEGWAAALQLAALALPRQADPRAFLKGFGGTHQHLLSYLAEEVFSQQPPARQAFLLATCVLDRLCAPLCAAVLADPAAPPPDLPPGPTQAVLDALAADQLFLLALDSTGQWYRYHTLFADALRHQLRRTAPAQERIYRQRASAWLAQAGYGAEAIGQALAAQDWERAADQIEQFADGAWERGELRTLAGWLAALPDALRRRPRLGVLQALSAMMANQYGSAAAQLVAVRQELAAAAARGEADGDVAERDRLLGRAAVLEAQVSRASPAAVAYSETLARQALELLPAADRAWRTMAQSSLGTSRYLASDLAAAVAHYLQAGDLATHAGFHLLALLQRSRAAAALHDQGHLREALALCTATRPLPAADEWPGLSQVAWAEALVRYEQGDLAAADALLDQAIPGAAADRQPEVQGFAEITRSRIALARGDRAGAAQALAAAQVLLDPPGAGNQHFAQILAAWREVAWLVHPGAVEIPPAAGPEAAEAAQVALAHWIWRPHHLLPAWRHLRAGAPAAAHRYLEDLATRAAAVDARTLLIAVLALDSLALDAVGRPAAAQAALLRAVTLSAPDGHVRAILDSGPAVLPLLAALAQHLAQTPREAPELLAYVAHVQGAAGARATALPPAPPVPRPSPGVSRDSLTERELAVLRLVAAGYSNQEIADQLIIGVSTVKWYLRIIYEKLDSANRTQAVARARAQGLIR